MTGTFTDLGIELAQVLQKNRDDRSALKSRIMLRAAIIFFFMAGALAGAFLYRRRGFDAFPIPVVLMLIALLYDILRITVKRYYRQLHPVKKD